MISHDQADDLLGAFALDAVEDSERDAIEAHLRECPRCGAELMGLRDVATALGNCVESVPEGLWSIISSQLGTVEQEQPTPSLVRLFSRAEVDENDRRPTGGAPPQTRAVRRYLTVVTSVAAAAVAAATILGVSLTRTSEENDRLQAQMGTNGSSVVAALETPGHILLSLRGNHRQFAQVVLVPGGRGYLVSSSLPKLTDDHTYQLWGVIGGQPISLGLLGPDPRQAAFTVGGSAEPIQLGVTVEPRGGSVVPTSAMVASSTTRS